MCFAILSFIKLSNLDHCYFLLINKIVFKNADLIKKKLSLKLLKSSFRRKIFFLKFVKKIKREDPYKKYKLKIFFFLKSLKTVKK